jgi:ATP-dependent RNA helicase SUPV3L1/SUV3
LRRRQGNRGHGGDKRLADQDHDRKGHKHRATLERERGQGGGQVKRFERRERDKAPDPNSPFAKLAALKAQLEADAKERR